MLLVFDFKGYVIFRLFLSLLVQFMGIVKNQFTAFMEAISHNLKRMIVLHEIYPPQTT
jgi:hypothetical protein